MPRAFVVATVGVAVVAFASIAHAQPTGDPSPTPPPPPADAPPTDAPTEPPPTTTPPPPVPPTPPAPDPLAIAMTNQAHSLALRGACEDVEVLAYRVRSLAPDVYRERFATDRAIISCDPRVVRRERAEGLDASAYHAIGFMLGIDLAIDRVPFENPSFSGTTADGTTLTPRTRVYLGYQGRSVSVGGTVVFDHAAAVDSNDPMNQTTTSISTVLVGPTLRAQLWQNRTARVELLLALDLAFGYTWQSLDPDQFMQSPPKDVTAAARAGLGLRYWLAPSFAIGVTGGIAVSYQEDNEQFSTDMSGQSAATTATAVDLALAITGVL
jgi:hypothetical protein